MDTQSQKKISDAAISEFVSECEELSQRVSQNFALIEKGQFDHDTLDTVYRDMHTIKGSSQLFGFKFIGIAAHAMETCLDPVRRLNKGISPQQMEALYKCLDLIERMVKSVQEGKDTNFKSELEYVIPKLIEASLSSFGADLSVQKDTAPWSVSLEKPVKETAPVKPQPSIAKPVEQVPAPVHVEATPEKFENLSPKSEGVQLSMEPKNKPIMEVHEHAAPAENTANNEAKTSDAGTIRVPVSLLDKLMVLMGEMVLVRNQVLQYSNQSDDLNFLNLSQRLDLVTSELQNEVMKTRMQPIGNVLTKFQRVVRDLSRDLNKKMELTLEGTETELDKTLLEAIKDPLTHIVRNSCDHGIETPEERKKAGKSEVGHVCIRSYHEGGQVIVDIQDDGKGLNKEKLIAKALEKGIISQEKIAFMSEGDAFNLIFAPGFSTAAQVTNVSGRGVGMDVVKSNIEKIGGQAEILSQLGKGMTVRLKIPLTLAIVPAMIIRSGEVRYAIPQVKLVELVRVEVGNSLEQVEYLQGKPMYRLRGNLLPLVNLQEVLGLATQSEQQNSVTNIVVLNAEGQMFGLIVDEIQDTADIVVKPLSAFLKTLTLYSGATVLGDGSVSLILDVNGLANTVHLASRRKEDKSLGVGASDARSKSSDAQEFLLFKVNAQGKYAIPLNLVHRLEEFKLDQVEFSGTQRVLRYRGSILPIVSLNEFLKFPAPEKKEERSTLSVIVVKKSDKLYGVEVNDILDVSSVDANVDDSLKDRPGILGNIIMGPEVVVIVDILEVLSGEANRLGQKENVFTSSADKNITDFDQRRAKFPILFAEDTAFFRKHVCKVVQGAGYPVVTAIDGQEAFDKLDNGTAGDIKLLLSDIEMPKLNGLELAKALRKQEKYKTIPMIALTTKFSDRSVKEGKEAGFNEYLEKMNAEQLIKQLDAYLLK